MFAPPLQNDRETHDPIRLADWVELNLLMEEEPVVSVTGVADELASTPPDDSRDSEEPFEYDDPEPSADGQLRYGFREIAEGRAEGAFIELSERANWLGNNYPVEIDGSVAALRKETSARDIYSFLVLLRSRQLYQGALGDDGVESGFLFEELVKHALGAYAGSSPSQRVRFGVAGGSRGDGLSLPMAEAIQEVSRRMDEEPGHVLDSHQGDFKADAIVWKPFGDSLPGQLVVLGQATISEGDWLDDEPANRWTDRRPPDTRLILFLARPVTAVAFPETLSLTPPDVLDGLRLSFSSIPFDRLRLLSVLSDEDLPSNLRASMENWSKEMICRLPK